MGLQSLKSYIILQAYNWPYIKDKALRYERRNKAPTHQWTGRAYEHTLAQPDSQREREREKHMLNFSGFDRRMAVKTRY